MACGRPVGHQHVTIRLKLFSLQTLPFPDQLSSYDLTVESLSRAFDCAQSGSEEELLEFTWNTVCRVLSQTI